jgi:hypothetical protein
VRDKQLGPKVVPIIPDEARTFGMESLFRQLGIYSASGQLYQPEDSDKVMSLKTKFRIINIKRNHSDIMRCIRCCRSNPIRHRTGFINAFLQHLLIFQ